MEELREAFGTALHRSAKCVPTTAHDTRCSLLGSTIVVLLRHRATYHVIASSYHYAASPSQGIKGAYIHDTAANPSFFPSLTISAFSPFPPFCSSAPHPPNHTPIPKPHTIMLALPVIIPLTCNPGQRCLGSHRRRRPTQRQQE